MPDRIVLDPDEIAGLIRGARLPELRADTPADVREHWTQAALTAMDALCGLDEREGIDAVWNTLRVLEHREVLAFASLMADELSRTPFSGR